VRAPAAGTAVPSLHYQAGMQVSPGRVQPEKKEAEPPRWLRFDWAVSRMAESPSPGPVAERGEFRTKFLPCGVPYFRRGYTANMRLQGIDLHKLHHRYFRPRVW